MPSPATLPYRCGGYARCLYCGLWHECDEDGVPQGMCAAERKAKGPRGWKVSRKRV